MISSIASSNPLFLFESHLEKDEPPLRLEMRSFTSFFIDLILSRVSDLSGVGFVFQELIKDIRLTSSEDIEDTLIVASMTVKIVVIDGRVIDDEYDSSVMTDTISVVSD